MKGRKKIVWKAVDRVFSKMGYLLLDMEFLEDNLVIMYVLTPKWTIKEMTARIEFDGPLSFRLKFVRP